VVSKKWATDEKPLLREIILPEKANIVPPKDYFLKGGLFSQGTTIFPRKDNFLN
jgi:hypothetical protein